MDSVCGQCMWTTLGIQCLQTLLTKVCVYELIFYVAVTDTPQVDQNLATPGEAW